MVEDSDMQDFDARKEKENIIKWIRDWFSENGPRTTAVVGLSGGKDSTVVAALLKEALGPERVVGVLMPQGIQPDIDDSKLVVDFLGIPAIIVNVGAGAAAVLESVENACAYGAFKPDLSINKETKVNIPPRIRMSTLYAVASALPMGGRVANTCNRSEDYVGYSTKYGDAAGDFSPISDFTVQEVLAIGDELGLPKSLVHKTPSDGLSGMSDEDKLGFTYKMLDEYIETGVCPDEKIKEKIDRLHAQNLHKLRIIPAYKRER